MTYNELQKRYDELAERYNELAERFEMAAIGFFKDHPQLINKNTIDEINDDGFLEVMESIFGYFDEERGGLDFGEYVLLNGYFSEADEEEIDKYIYDNDDADADTGYYKYNDLINIKDKLNFFSMCICFRTNMTFIINNEYLNRNNEVYLK
jgi:hypothetical protein